MLGLHIEDNQNGIQVCLTQETLYTSELCYRHHLACSVEAWPLKDPPAMAANTFLLSLGYSVLRRKLLILLFADKGSQKLMTYVHTAQWLSRYFLNARSDRHPKATWFVPSFPNDLTRSWVHQHVLKTVSTCAKPDLGQFQNSWCLPGSS